MFQARHRSGRPTLPAPAGVDVSFDVTTYLFKTLLTLPSCLTSNPCNKPFEKWNHLLDRHSSTAEA